MGRERSQPEQLRLAPFTYRVRFGRTSMIGEHCYADRFCIVRVETAATLVDAIAKTSSVPAFLASVFLRSVPQRGYKDTSSARPYDRSNSPSLRERTYA